MNDAILIAWLWNIGLVLVTLLLVAGLALIVMPGSALKAARYLSREYSFSWLLRKLDAPRVSEPFVFRHHRAVGIFLTLASAYLLQQLFSAVTPEAAVALWATALPNALALAVMQAGYWLLVMGGIAGLVLGIVIFIRPSLLKPLERWSNIWLPTDKMSEMLDRSEDRPEHLAHRHPRVVGLIVVTATLYIMLMTALLVA